MVYRVVICPKGTIRRMELLPPFAYLKEVTDRVRKGGGFEGKTKTSARAIMTRPFGTPSTPVSTALPDKPFIFASKQQMPAVAASLKPP
jgi:hypothetical protein